MGSNWSSLVLLRVGCGSNARGICLFQARGNKTRVVFSLTHCVDSITLSITLTRFALIQSKLS